MFLVLLCGSSAFGTFGLLGRGFPDPLERLSLTPDVDARSFVTGSRELKYDVGLRAYLSTPRDGKELVEVILMHDGRAGTAAKLVSRLAGLGAELLYDYRVIPGIAAWVSVEALPVVASWNEVSKIHKVTPTQLPAVMPGDPGAPAAAQGGHAWWRQQVGLDGVNYTGAGVKVAILDSGLGLNLSNLRLYHSDLDGRIVVERNFARESGQVNPEDVFDENGHGTHVAGIAAGNGTSSNGLYAGVAPEALVLNLKVANWSGSIDTADIVAAIEFAIEQDVDVISMSFGGGFPEPHNPETAALANATSQGIVCVAAAGNSGPEFFTSGSPGSGPDVMTVGATNSEGELASFSSRGPALNGKPLPDLLAPGVDVIAPAAPLSFTSTLYSFLDSIVPGLPDSYVALSGTSMATPFVSGAAALLLEAHPEATPEAIRWALQRSASPVTGGGSANEAGAGILNVSGALALLDSLPDPNNVTYFSPASVLDPPFDLLRFPGDSTTFNLSVFSGVPGTYTATTSASPGLSSSFVESGALSFSSHGRKDLVLRIAVEPTATAGPKTAQINLTRNVDGMVVDQFNFTVDVAYPRAKAYFDSFHGLADWYLPPPLLPRTFDFYETISSFVDANVSCTYFMDNWTWGYDSSVNATLLTRELLSGYDVLVLLPPVAPYAPSELAAVKEFYDAGGALLVLATVFQAFSTSSLDGLLDELGVGIQTSTVNVLNATNEGLALSLDPVHLDPFGAHPLVEGVSDLTWLSGLALNATSPAQAVVTSGPHQLVAFQDDSGSGRGRVVVAGSLDPFLNAQLRSEDNGKDHRTFLKNIVDVLLADAGSGRLVGVVAAPELQGATTTTLHAYLTDQNGLPVPASPGFNVNATLTYPNATTVPLVLDNGTSPLMGLAFNASVPLGPANATPHAITLQADLDGGVIQKTLKFVLVPSPSPVVVSTTLLNDVVYRDGEQSVHFTVELSTPSGVDSVKLYSGSTATTIFNSRQTTKLNQSLTKSVPKPNKWSTSITATPGQTAGYYASYFLVQGSDGRVSPRVNRTLHEVANNPPEIEKNASYFGDYLFEETEDEDEGLVYLVPATARRSYAINVKLRETVAYEDVPSQLRAEASVGLWMAFKGYLNVVGFATTTELSPSESGALTGDLYVPQTFTFHVNGTNVTRDMTQFTTFGELVYVTAKDSEGGFADFIVVLSVNAPPSAPIGPTDVIFAVVVVAVIGVALLLLLRRSRGGGWEEEWAEEDSAWDWDDPWGDRGAGREEPDGWY
ncbi:MAG: hypothetical protein Kow0069_01560 [Promethearchaeota archaeon]